MKSVHVVAVRVSVAAALIVTVAFAAAFSSQREEKAQATPQRKVFADSVVPLPKQSGLTPQGLMVHPPTDEHKNDKLDILFSLSIPEDARKKLEAKVAK